jgi:peptide/nickel transport system permease protein
VFSAPWRWPPAAYGAGAVRRPVLPPLTLAVGATAARTRLIRSFLPEALAAPHREALRPRGAPERRIQPRHMFGRAPPTIDPLRRTAPVGLPEGAVVVEVVFARPGPGQTFVEALRARDSPAIIGFVAVAVLLCAAANALAGALPRGLDPRLRDAAHR